MARQKQSRRQTKDHDRFFTLLVYLINGLVSDEFVEKNPVVCRTIQIRGDQTLRELHQAIFDAFDRYDEHLYEFQLGGEEINDPNAAVYALPEMMDDGPFGIREFAGTVGTPIGELGLKRGDIFGYRFDYGDEWWHQINVRSVEENAGEGGYPRVVERLGESPPQYMSFDEEDEEIE